MTSVVQEKGRIAKSLGSYGYLGDPTENRFVINLTRIQPCEMKHLSSRRNRNQPSKHSSGERTAYSLSNVCNMMNTLEKVALDGESPVIINTLPVAFGRIRVPTPYPANIVHPNSLGE